MGAPEAKLIAVKQSKGPVAPPLDTLKDVTAKVMYQLNIIPALCTKADPCQGSYRRKGTAGRDIFVHPWKYGTSDVDTDNSPDWIGPSLYDTSTLPPDRRSKKFYDDNVVNYIESHTPIPLEWLKDWKPRALSNDKQDLDRLDIIGYKKLELDKNLNPMREELEFIKPKDLVPPKTIIDLGCKPYVFERSGDVSPKIVSVIWPDSLIRDNIETLPFYIYRHPLLSQARDMFTGGDNLGEYDPKIPKDKWRPYPYGWGFLFHVLWSSNNYRRPGLNNNYIVGQAHQIAIAEKPVITIVPVVELDDGKNVGDFNDPQMILKILKEIYIAVASLNHFEPSEPNFRVAIGAFSDANCGFSAFLRKRSSFMEKELQEVYIFDPPGGKACPPLSGSDCSMVIASAIHWAGDTEKVVRVYSQCNYHNLYPLTGNNIPKEGFIVFNNQYKNRSYAFLPSSFWNKFKPADLKTSNVHSMIPSTMLVDAIRRSGF